MSSERTVTTTGSHRVRVIIAWVVGIVGVAATLVSIAPALSSTLGSLSVLTVVVFALALVLLAVPVFLALAIASGRRKWWLWLLAAVISVVIVLILAPAFGSLGVFWMRF